MSATLCTDPNLVLITPTFFLRPLTPGDVGDAYKRWLNDAATTRFLESRPGGTTIEGLRAYVAMHESRTDSLLLGIFERPGERHVGNVKLEPIDWRHLRATLGIMIGEADARGRGLGTAVVRRVLRFAFDELKLHRVHLGVTSDNVGAIRSYERIGFVREGCLRESIQRESGFVDSYTYGILSREFSETGGGA